MMCMQMRPPLSKNKLSSISGILGMIIIMKMVSTYMFPWSRIIKMSLKMSKCVVDDFNSHIGVVEPGDEESIGRFGW